MDSSLYPVDQETAGHNAQTQGSEENEMLEVLQTNTVQEKPLQQKVWKCPFQSACGKIFLKEQYMLKHVSVMHLNSEMVQCSICLKYLSTAGRLKNHMVLHTEVKGLVCLLCVGRRERATELSVMRHHLLERHGVRPKHTLFHKSYYKLSLKEMSIEGGTESGRRVKRASQSATNMEGLRAKIEALSSAARAAFGAADCAIGETMST